MFRRTMLTVLISSLGTLILVTTDLQQASASPNTHYGYFNELNGELEGSNNTCDFVNIGSTSLAVMLYFEPGPVKTCLDRYPAIRTVVIKSGARVSRTWIDDEFNKVWSGNKPDQWRDMPGLFPDVNFVMEIGNEPATDKRGDPDDPNDRGILVNQDPWTVAWHQKDTINFFKSNYSNLTNLFYAAALGNADPDACHMHDNKPPYYCGLDYVNVLVSGQQVCEAGWGCTFHRYWDDTTGFTGPPSQYQDLVNYIQGSPNIPRAAVTEQGINNGGVYDKSEDCLLRQYTNSYPSKVIVALTYITYKPGGDPPGYRTYGIDSASDIDFCVA